MVEDTLQNASNVKNAKYTYVHRVKCLQCATKSVLAETEWIGKRYISEIILTDKLR